MQVSRSGETLELGGFSGQGRVEGDSSGGGRGEEFGEVLVGGGVGAEGVGRGLSEDGEGLVRRSGEGGLGGELEGGAAEGGRAGGEGVGGNGHHFLYSLTRWK